MKALFVFVSLALTAAASAEYSIFPVRDPSKVWNREELYRVPKVRAWPGQFKGDATPVLIEGEPWKGKKTWVFAYYGVPEWATREHPAPAIVLVHGGAGTAYPEWVRLWVRRGYAAIAVDTCGAIPVFQSDNTWLANPEGGPRGWGRVDLADEPEKDQWPYHAVAAVMRGHSFLRSLPEVDAKNAGVTGVSWGAFLTCILAAADDRFAYAMPVYGCGFNFEAGGIVAGLPGTAKWSAMWDPCVFLPLARCPFLWLDGTNDFSFSLDRVRRSAALAPVEHAFVTRLRMVHSHGPVSEAASELYAFAEHFANGRPDVVRFTSVVETNGILEASFRSNGRRIERAELLYTLEGEGVKWSDRHFRVMNVDDFDPKSGFVRVNVPTGAYAFVLNVIACDGKVSSTPYQRGEGYDR